MSTIQSSVDQSESEAAPEVSSPPVPLIFRCGGDVGDKSEEVSSMSISSVVGDGVMGAGSTVMIVVEASGA